MFVALSRFRIADGLYDDGLAEELRRAFVRRPRLVDAADGFVRLDVLRPEGAPGEFWLLTYWRDGTSFRRWHRSHLYKDSHRGIPKGLKLDPRSVRLEFLEHVTS